MTDIVITEQNLETGMLQAVGALKVSYPDEEDAINSIVSQGYMGLVLTPGVKAIVDNAALSGSITKSFYGNLAGEAEQGARGLFVIHSNKVGAA